MTKEQQDLSWACLPKEARNKIISAYACNSTSTNPYNGGYSDALRQLYGHHNLTSDTEPEELLFAPKWRVEQYLKGLDVCIDISDSEQVKALRTALGILFGDKCLPDKPINGAIGTTPPSYKLDVKPEQPSVQVEPMFSKGDKVKVVNDAMHNGKIGKVIDIDRSMIAVELDDGTCVVWHERYFEPYTEPETKDAYEQYKEAEAEKYKNQLKDMEEKELNLIEILKNCQKGERFFSLIAGDVTFQGVDSHWEQAGWKPIRCTGGDYNSDGTYTDPSDKGICCLYPSRSLYEKYPLAPVKAWREWQENRKPKRWRAEKWEEYIFIDTDGILWRAKEEKSFLDDKRHKYGNYFKDDETAQQAAEAVMETLMKFHEQNQKQ